MATDPTFDGTGLRVLTLDEIIANIQESIAGSPELGKIETWSGAHTHPGVTVGAGVTGTAAPIAAPGSVAATMAKVK